MSVIDPNFKGWFYDDVQYALTILFRVLDDFIGGIKEIEEENLGVRPLLPVFGDGGVKQQIVGLNGAVISDQAAVFVVRTPSCEECEKGRCATGWWNVEDGDDSGAQRIVLLSNGHPTV